MMTTGSGKEASGRLRIAYVYDGLYPYFKGGAERRYFELGKRLSERHDVHYLTWRHWGTANDAEHAGFDVHGVGAPRAFYGGDGKRTIHEAAAFATLLIPALARSRYDVIDCSATPYLPLYSCWLVSRITRTPLVTTWHEFWGPHWNSYLPHRPAVARIARLLEAACRPLGDAVVAVSPFTARRLARGRGGISARVVANGVSVDEIRKVAPAPEHTDIVFVGRLIEDKKVDVLLKAVSLMASEFPAVRCTIVGDGPERLNLDRLTHQLALATRVRFTGQVADGRNFALMRAAKILALPSIREGFGITVVEGQAAGCVPVVVRGPHTAAPDLVRDGVDGLICDPTPQSLAARLSTLLRDPQRLESMRNAAYEAALTWDWDHVAIEMERVYRQAVNASLTS